MEYRRFGNTIVARIDRLAERDEIPRFAAASRMLCSEVLDTDLADTALADGAEAALLTLREAIDGHFRNRATGGDGQLAPLLFALATAESTGDRFLKACVRSTLAPTSHSHS